MELEILSPDIKVKLTVPLIASYLKNGYKQSKIAELCNVSFQAVSDYIKRHNEEFLPLVAPNDNYMATKAQIIASKAQDRLLNHLDESTKKDLMALNAISGTHVDKYMLLSGKPTEIHANFDIAADLNKLIDQIKNVK